MNKLFTMLLLCCLLTSVQADNGVVGDELDDDAMTQGLCEAIDSYLTLSRGSNNNKYEIVSIERIYELPPRRPEGAPRSFRHCSVLTTLKETRTRNGVTETKTKYASHLFDYLESTKGFKPSGVRISGDSWSTYEKYQQAILAYDNSKTSRIIYPKNFRQERENHQVSSSQADDGLDDDAITQGLCKAVNSYWTKSRSINNVKYEIVSIERIYELPPKWYAGAPQSLRHFSVFSTLKETSLRKGATKMRTYYENKPFVYIPSVEEFKPSGGGIGWSPYEKYQQALSAYDNSKTSRIIYPKNLRQERENHQVSSHGVITNSFSITPYFLVSKKNFNEAIIDETKSSKEVIMDLNKLKPIQGQVSGSEDCKGVYLQWEGKIFDVVYETQSDPSYVCCYYSAVTIMLFDPQKKTQIWKDVLMLEEQNNTSKREIVADGKLVMFNIEITPGFYEKGENVNILGNPTQTKKKMVISASVDFETFK